MLAGLLAMGAAIPCSADDVAVLRNGFSIRHERRETIGEVTRLYVSADNASYIDVPTSEIEHFEAAPKEDANKISVKSVRLPASGAPNVTNNRDLNEVVNTSSEKYRLDPDLVNSVIKAESGFNVRAVSRKGAQGLMQLMPDTASQLGVPDAFDAQANVDGGAKYLRELLERYNFDLVKALAAYNAGPRRVEQYGGVPPYYETRAYVARIVKDFNKKKLAEKNAVKTASQKSAQSSTTVKKTSVKKTVPASKAQVAANSGSQ